MFKFPKRNEITPEILVKLIWVSTFMAMIFALPALGIFLGIYFITGNLIVGAITGFAIHFVILAFSDRISKYLTKIMN